MARLIDENFEGAGYEETWAETVDAGCTLDEDAAIPGVAPPGAGSQCLQAIVVDESDDDAYAEQDEGNQNISYVRGYLYLDVEGLSDGQGFNTLRLLNDANSVAAQIQILQISSVLKARFFYYSSSAAQTTAVVTISLDTWYRFEYQYDITNSDWEWKIDGATQHSGSLASNIRTPDKLVVGIGGHTGTASSTLLTDLVVWDDAVWPGSEGYTITAGGGSYGMTGQATGLLADRKVPIGSGTFNITGTAAGLLRGYPLTADSGAYNIAGQEVGILKDSLISIDSGTYSLTGSALDLLRGYHLGIEAGAYALSGEDVSLLKDSKLTAQSGAYNISGQAATLLRGYLVNAQVGNYDISGQDTNLLKGFVIGLKAGGYDLSGQDVELIYSGEALTIGCMTVTFDSKQPLIMFDSKQPSITFQDRCDNN